MNGTQTYSEDIAQDRFGDTTFYDGSLELMCDFNKSNEKMLNEQHHRNFVNFYMENESFMSNNLIESDAINSFSFLINLHGNIPEVEPTADESLYFKVGLNENKTVFYELFLKDEIDQPKVVFLIYEGDDCIANGKGSLPEVQSKIKMALPYRLDETATSINFNSLV